MSVILVTYDLKSPGQDYDPVHDYLKKFKHCKKLESVWLLDTTKEPSAIRDDLKKLVDDNDVLFVVKLVKKWAASNYKCGNWLNDDERNW
tara:strand:- start:412 stop:681 length:270 start_codon:yes stop_codon:yes gene_type:complete